MKTRIGIINVSDRAAAGVYEETRGKAVVALLERGPRLECDPAEITAFRPKGT